MSPDNPIGAVLAFLAAGVGPTYLGLFLILFLRRSSEAFGRFVASIASGIALALFFDLVSNASALGLSLGSRGSATQILLVISFVVGLLALFLLDGKIGQSDQPIPTAILYVIALGTAFHSLAEGIVVGYDIRTTGLSEELSTIVQGVSFALHKAGEGFVIASLFIRRINWRNIVVAGGLASFPGLLGALLGTFGIPGVVSSFMFAAGAGASIYIITKTIPVAVSKSNITMAVGIVLGYLFIYGAGIIHNL